MNSYIKIIDCSFVQVQNRLSSHKLQGSTCLSPVCYMVLLASAHQGTVWKGQERTPVVRARDCSLHSLTLPNATATDISSVALLTTMTRDSKQRQLFSLLISYQAASVTFLNCYISFIFYKH